jgi:hypothetical protein
LGHIDLAAAKRGRAPVSPLAGRAPDVACAFFGPNRFVAVFEPIPIFDFDGASEVWEHL